ncbi:MAG: hypothetical protein RQ722_01500 [Desulfuromonadales bacterium]|nr:hypothetical protein [Desulfuromonadales bacterium]
MRELNARGKTMHPWHDIEVDSDQIYDRFPAVIEIPTGPKNKYELDKPSGMLKLDRLYRREIEPERC